MEFKELERQILLHRRTRRKEILVLAAIAAGALAVLGVVALIVWRVL